MSFLSKATQFCPIQWSSLGSLFNRKKSRVGVFFHGCLCYKDIETINFLLLRPVLSVLLENADIKQPISWSALISDVFGYRQN
mmetsp:Transcript_55128/g.61647  ORF Transcript_55128/g.61647 Transcript_55128/m.61647 type:complete len:83 (+) Transcript_55128:3884-4132(+)